MFVAGILTVYVAWVGTRTAEAVQPVVQPDCYVEFVAAEAAAGEEGVGLAPEGEAP